ncbi:MAG: tRNA (adenosine(37)-N6)-dimethylallyltransferase MiaA [Thermoanaerobacteraceae bacterium]|nr:tRNA (adenosine(37)-N6)-dimethylallyltransferase MiaA [Thermoanaerobacteraceae bacterium]
MKLPLAVIVGPTAVGKSAAAVEVADKLNGEIISADSMQVYRGMDIGTAKVTREDMISSSGKYIPHHMIDIVDPTENYSVAHFQKDARRLITQINGKGKLPILVGGTGLYVQAVIDPYEFSEEAGNFNIRQELKEKAARVGYEKMYELLRKIDPLAAEKIHPNDKKRIIRALEYYYSTGKIISEKWQQAQKSLYKLTMVGLTMKRDLLYQRINARVDKMLEQGLVAEVQQLLDQGVKPQMNAMQGLGYKQIAAYCLGEISLREAIRRLKRDTRRFAKRQLTWFRRDKRIYWIDVSNLDQQEVVQEMTAYISRSLRKIVE